MKLIIKYSEDVDFLTLWNGVCRMVAKTYPLGLPLSLTILTIPWFPSLYKGQSRTWLRSCLGSKRPMEQ